MASTKCGVGAALGLAGVVVHTSISGSQPSQDVGNMRHVHSALGARERTSFPSPASAISLAAVKVQDKRIQHGSDLRPGFFYRYYSVQAPSAANIAGARGHFAISTTAARQAPSAANVAAPRGRAVPISSAATLQEWSQATARQPSAELRLLDCAQNWMRHAGPDKLMTQMAPSFEKPSHDWQTAEEPTRKSGMPYVHSASSMSEGSSASSRPAPMRNDTPKVEALIPCEGSDDSAIAGSNSPDEVPPLPRLLGNLRAVEKPPKKSTWCQEVDQQAHLFLPGVLAGSETLGVTDFESTPEEAAELLGPEGFRRVEKLQWLQKSGRRYTKEAQAKKHLSVFHTLRWRPDWHRNYTIAEDYPLLVQQAVRIWAHQPLPATVVPLNPGLATSVPEPSTHHRERASRQWKGTKRFAQTFAL